WILSVSPSGSGRRQGRRYLGCVHSPPHLPESLPRPSPRSGLLQQGRQSRSLISTWVTSIGSRHAIGPFQQHGFPTIDATHIVCRVIAVSASDPDARIAAAETAVRVSLRICASFWGSHLFVLFNFPKLLLSSPANPCLNTKAANHLKPKLQIEVPNSNE